MIPDATFKLEADPDNNDGQKLLFRYPSVTAPRGDYIRAPVKVEAGAKSALGPPRRGAGADLTVGNITTVMPERTFWGKVMIVHGLRQWHERRKDLRHRASSVITTTPTGC